MSEYSNYPNQIDTTTELPKATDNVTPVKAELFNRLRDAIVSVENELGIQPSSIYSTVKDRLDAMDGRISSISGGGTGGVSKEYVDLSIQSLKIKEPVLLATGLGEFPLPYTVVDNVFKLNSVGYIDLPILGYSVLLSGEVGSNAPFNGIYVVTDIGSPTTPFTMVRRDDADTSEKVAFGMCVIALSSFDEDSGSIWVLKTPDPIELNVTPLEFGMLISQNEVQQIVPGDGLDGQLAGDQLTLSVKNADSSINVSSSGVKVGVISDTQHGDRGGGSLHSLAVAGGDAGFIDGNSYQLLTQATSDPENTTLFKRDSNAGGSVKYINITPWTKYNSRSFYLWCHRRRP